MPPALGRCLVVWICLLAASGVQADKVYKWIDDNGQVNYGNAPPQGVKAVPVEAEISVIPRLGVPAPKPVASEPVTAPERPHPKPRSAEKPASAPSQPAPSDARDSDRPADEGDRRAGERPVERPLKQVEPCEPGVDCRKPAPGAQP